MPGRDRRLETPSAVLPEWNQWFTAVGQIVRELNDLGHAAEVLPEPDATPVTDLRQVEEALVYPIRV